MSAPARERRAAGTPPNRVQVLSADAYRDMGGTVPSLDDGTVRGRPAAWVLFVGDELVAVTEEQMPDSLAEEWGEQIVAEDYSGFAARFRHGPRNAGHLIADLPLELVAPTEPARPSWWQRRRQARAQRRAGRQWGPTPDHREPQDAPRETPERPAPPADAPVGAPDPGEASTRSGPGVAARAGAALARGARCVFSEAPRFWSQAPPSVRALLVHARSGAWTTAEEGSTTRQAMSIYVYVVALPLLLPFALLAWAAPVPARLVLLVVTAVVLATTVNLLPLGDLLVPDAVTVTSWFPPLDPRGGS